MPYVLPIVSKSPLRIPTVRSEAFQIRLEAETVRLLDEARALHQLAYESRGVDEKVSRNDIIQAFLKWALDVFFKDVGGVPVSAAEKKRAVDRVLEMLSNATSQH